MVLSVSKLGACAVVLALLACGHKSNNVRDSARESLGVDQQAPAATPPPAAVLPGTPSGLVKHYICPNNCEGGSGNEAGTCAVCGTAFVHNQAYHSQTPATQTEKVTFPGVTTTAPAGTTPPPTPPAPEPPQNASGVWHYTCANGCAGGAGGAGTCASCGGALAHNAAYHQ